MFGRLVGEHRRRLGLTQEDLAARTGVSVRTIREMEADRRRAPRAASVRLLADAFGLQGAQRETFLLAASAPTATAPPGRSVPAQLPADVTGFTGRAAELDRLDSVLTSGGVTAIICAVAGTAGVGKTALAVRWGHRSRERFPDGQLYVDLRGYDPGRPVDPADALARMLAALGVPPAEIPLGLDEQAARYRTQLARRRMLVVLDNAGTVDQVRPLLPGAGDCVTLVTSRDSLAGLVARDGAYRLDLDLLPVPDATALLRRLIGPRVDDEPGAVAKLIEQCARLPLALRVAAELAAARPGSALAELVAELADQQQRLGLLDPGGDQRSAVAAVFSWSLRSLPPAAARTFRLLGLHPGPDFDAYAAAALADLDRSAARRALRELARAHLIDPAAEGRYAMHDLLHAYAAQLAADSGDDHGAARQRLLDHYLASAVTAANVVYPEEADRLPRVERPATPVPDLTGREAARDWLEAERACLVAVVARGGPRYSVPLAAALFRHLLGGHYQEALTVHGHARDDARATGDPAGEAMALLGSGTVHSRLCRHREATADLTAALGLFERVGDGLGQARTLGNLGAVEQRTGRHAEAVVFHERARAMFRRLGDPLGEARAVNNLGEIEARLGHYPAAARWHREALALHERTGDRTGLGAALTNLGEIEEKLGNYAAAAEHQLRALELFRGLGHRSGEAWTMDGIGVAYTGLGRPHDSPAYHESALGLFREIGEQDGEASALNGLGEAARAAGRPAEAVAQHTAALTAATEADVPDQLARAHLGLGRSWCELGRPEPARSHLHLALDGYAALGRPEADDVRAALAALS
ncbi:ATP-binding protein [Actinoplanes solisilvae]|uniref:ATP-binding protein n=1 Tax=Actinoplanes solisilvae TaxID=2486853 RepID=UPI000FD8561F|nr:tetratricopeptide repeat protein [Actinoplanes solisilvae]